MEPEQERVGKQDEPTTEETATTEEATATTPATPTSEPAVEPDTSTSPETPSPPKDNARTMEHDSLVTVRLSEPPALTVNTNVGTNSARSTRFGLGGEYVPSNAMAEIVREEEDRSEEATDSGAADGPVTSLHDELRQQDNDELEEGSEPAAAQASSGSFPGLESDTVTTPVSDSEEVDWDELQKSEDQQVKDQDTDNTVLLLARLEQENAKLATNPKSVKVQVVETQQSPTRRPRPPSMAQLRDMIRGPTPPALRYSMLPPPPMTDLEFYAALVKDYQQTAARLPTLLSNKIRKGVPPPLRGVVWQSMAGSRDSTLEELFERFSGESSPYEGIIGKDLGRSFPGVDMFRDPDGDGQRMLGRVLKCFSLHEPKIGYCQGLAFLVGPLLMHMPDKQAFCVLVRLMENYDLRNSYTPDLSGLHVRIYQFRELLREHLPTLSAHLEALQVDPAYVSQWFLSFFAVTCPLPMLFRIYDVLFAEGASETIMRVALSLMQKNQGRILACSEMEDVMQLLLSRGLWDCYHYNADEFVQDFTSLSNVVTRERLFALEQGYREAQTSPVSNTTAAANETRALDVTTAASRFLGRLWVSSTSTSSNHHHSTSSPKSSSASTSTLSPGLSAPLRPLSMLRRSASKQSLASTLNSMEAASSSSSSVLSSASTDATSLSRDSSASDEPSSTREFATSTPGFSGPTSHPSKPSTIGGGGGASSSSSSSSATTTAANINSINSRKNPDSRYLHSQIEDLLTALSDLQRQHALLADQLQREREERSEDRKAVRSLLDGLRKKASDETIKAADSEQQDDTASTSDAEKQEEEQHLPTAEELSGLLDTVEARFGTEADDRRSSVPQTKLQLRDELARAKEQLSNELAKGQDRNRRVYEMEQEVATMRDQLRESHAHVRNLHQEKQRLEKQMHAMRGRVSSETPQGGGGSLADTASEWFGRTNTGGSAGGTGVGLRELKLGRSKSTPSQVTNGSSAFNKRSSSLTVRGAGDSGPISENDALLLDLVQAKTAEAIARQEAEEAKQKLESLRKALGLSPADLAAVSQGGSAASAAAATAMGMLGRLTTSISEATSNKAATVPAAAPPATAPAPAAAATTSTSSGYGSFFGWRR